MPPRRIIVLHSFAHEGTEERIGQVDANPALQNVEFHHIAVMDEDGEPFKRLEARVSEQLRRGSTSTDIYQIQRDEIGKMLHDEVMPSLLAQIEEFKPDALIIHGGTAFRQAAEQFIQILIHIRKTNPDLPFALEGKSEWIQWLHTARAREYYGSDYVILTRRIGWVTSHFIDDAEIDEIIDELF